MSPPIVDPQPDPAPPTSPTHAKDLGTFGIVDSNTHMFRSYDSGMEGVGYNLQPEMWYKFSVQSKVTGDDISFVASVLRGDSYNAAYDVLDSSLNIVGSLDNFGSAKLNHIYYIRITASSTTHYRFSIIARPALNSFSNGNNAGTTEDTATTLGALATVLQFYGRLYSFYNRKPIESSPSSAEGVLSPNYDDPSPSPPVQTGFWKFELAKESKIKLFFPWGSTATGVVYNGGDWIVFRGSEGITVDLGAGVYIIRIIDSLTVISPDGKTFYRDPCLENYETYNGELLVLNP
jgi:hypothetical protein